MTIKNKGFTLIELLVVIAIIGILSGLIIVSMSGANNSAKNARIQSDMDQLRTTAQLWYLSQTPNTYVGVTGASTSGSILVSDIAAQGGTVTLSISGTSKYCAITVQNGTPSSWWCIDSDGNSKQLTASTQCSGGSSWACQ
ncbi:MAG: prepilin-type N-terminal cleavage/methylation domain-containing protein [Candidatus Paceibacterota bacterium]